MGLSRNKVAVSEGAAGSPPFYGERAFYRKMEMRIQTKEKTTLDGFIKKYTVVQFSGTKRFLKVGVINAQGPPVPIPNTEVKLCSADNTSPATVREDRSRPTPIPDRLETTGQVDRKPKALWGCSSAGRAPALQAGGHGFESHHLHQKWKEHTKLIWAHSSAG